MYRKEIKILEQYENIEFYEDKNGKSEVIDYIAELVKNNSKDNRIKLKK